MSLYYRCLLLLFISLPFCCVVTAQTDSLQSISGTVIDDESEEPIAFVYILLAKDQNQGVLSNEKGEFQLNYGASSLSDTILVSRLGYELYKLALSDVSVGEDLIIRLKSSAIRIDAVTVTASNTPQQIIQIALGQASKIYGYEPSQAKAFYRQYGFRNGAYTDITEAHVTIRDQPYASPDVKSTIYLDQLDRHVYNDEQVSDGVFSSLNPIYSLYEKQNNSARFQHIHWMSFGRTDFFEAFDFAIKGVHLSDRDTIVEISYKINPERAGISEAALNTLSGWTRGEVAINTTDYGIVRNVRGDANGNVFSEVYYVRASGRYYPSRITSIYAIEYDEGEYFVTNQTLFIMQVTNQPRRIKAYDADFKIPRKKGFAELNFQNKDNENKSKTLLRLGAPDAAKLDASRREYQRNKLGAE